MNLRQLYEKYSGPVARYTGSAGIYFASSLIPMLLTVLINPLIALNMSPEDYAISGYYNSFSALITPVIIFYMLHYYSKRYFEVGEQDRLRLKACLFKALVFFSFAMSALCLVVLLGYILLLGEDFTFPIFPYLALMVFAIPLSGIYKLEQTDFRMSRNARGFFRLTVSAGLILVVLNLLLVVIAKLGALGKMLAPFLANLAVFLWLLFRHRSLFRVQTGMRELQEVLKFCLPLALGAMLGYFSNGFDRTWLQRLGDVNEYGHYIVGAQIAGYLTVFSTAVTSTFQPDIYESIARRDNKAFLRTCLLQVGLITAIVAVFIIFCPLLIRLLTAGRYVDATPYARIVSVSVITSAIYYVINNYTIAKGYPRLYLYTTVVSTVIIVACYPFMTGHFGYTGGAWMTGISFVILAAVNLVLLLFVRLSARKSDK